MTLPPKGPPSSIELSSSATPFKHEPVMLQEMLETFNPIESGLFIDAREEEQDMPKRYSLKHQSGN